MYFNLEPCVAQVSLEPFPWPFSLPNCLLSAETHRLVPLYPALTETKTLLECHDFSQINKALIPSIGSLSSVFAALLRYRQQK